MNNVDFIKVVLTYGIAIIVVVGGGIVLVSGMLPKDDQLTTGAIIGFMGIALNWTFGETTRSSTARQTTRAIFQTPPTQEVLGS